MTEPATSFALQPVGGGPELVRVRPGDAVTIGRDPQNRVQVGHGSIDPFHATLRCDDWGVWIAPIGAASVEVSGEKTTQERLVALGATVTLGSLAFNFVPLDVIAARSMKRQHLRNFLETTAGFTISLALHATILWRLAVVVVQQRGDAERDEPISMLLGNRDGAVDPLRDDGSPIAPALDRTPIPALAQPAEVEVPPLAAPVVLDQLPLPESAPGVDFGDGLPGGGDLAGAFTTIGVGNSGGFGGTGNGAGTGQGRGLIGSGRLSLDGDLGGAPLAGRIKELRGCGVDLVFVIDATSSMRPFLEGARTAAGTLVSKLATLIEDLRVGVVAYRDQGDEFVTRVLKLSDERYAILNFLWSMRAEGGGDVPEAVADGLETAIKDAGWRPKCHHVIVLVGDAPPHSQDWSRLKGSVARFVRGDKGKIPGSVVSAIYTGPARTGAASPVEDGAQAFAEIARLGRGDFLDLGANADVAQRLTLLIVGPRHASELDALLARVRDDPREQVVHKRAADGDVMWLLARLRRPPVLPSIVDALIRRADKKVLWEARQLVADPARSRETREAALYILRRCLPLAGEFDLDGAPETQKAALNELDAMISRR